MDAAESERRGRAVLRDVALDLQYQETWQRLVDAGRTTKALFTTLVTL